MNVQQEEELFPGSRPASGEHPPLGGRQLFPRGPSLGPSRGHIQCGGRVGGKLDVEGNHSPRPLPPVCRGCGGGTSLPRLLPPTHRGSLPALGCGPDIIALWGEGVPAPAGPLTHAHPQRWGQLHRSTHSLTHRLLNLTLGAFPTPFSCSSRIPTPLGSQTMRN